MKKVAATRGQSVSFMEFFRRSDEEVALAAEDVLKVKRLATGNFYVDLLGWPMLG
jgi:hypothetical protein